MASVSSDRPIRRLEPTLDPDPPEVPIGLVVPYDFVLDAELWRYVPPEVSLHISRTRYRDLEVTIEMADEVADGKEVADAVRRLTHAAPVSTAYVCTIGSYVDGLAGETALRGDMEAAGAANPLTTSGAFLEALDSLQIDRVGVATPYDARLTEGLEAFLAAAGIEVVGVAYLGLQRDIFKVDLDTVIDLAIAADQPEADAILISCTNLRTFEAIPALEARLHKPVLTANQVTMWSALRRAGVASPHVHHRLFMIETAR